MTTTSRLLLLLLPLAALTVFICPSFADPVVWPTNGHCYEARLRPEGIGWQTAQNECLAEGGYLATLTSEAENDFVFSLLSEDPLLWRWGPFYEIGLGPWIGGVQENGALEPMMGWYWAETGEAWSYENWAEGEPNDGLPDEDYVHFFSGESGVLIGNFWNDAPGDTLLRGYVIEIDCTPVERANWGRLKTNFGS